MRKVLISKGDLTTEHKISHAIFKALREEKIIKQDGHKIDWIADVPNDAMASKVSNAVYWISNPPVKEVEPKVGIEEAKAPITGSYIVNALADMAKQIAGMQATMNGIAKEFDVKVEDEKIGGGSSNAQGKSI